MEIHLERRFFSIKKDPIVRTTPPPQPTYPLLTSILNDLANYGPDWPDLVRIRIWTFLVKLVRKRPELVTKSLIFTKLTYLMTHPKVDYPTFILGMNAWEVQGSPVVKLFAKRFRFYLIFGPIFSKYEV